MTAADPLRDIEDVMRKAIAGLCQSSAHGKHAFLCDILKIGEKYGVNPLGEIDPTIRAALTATEPTEKFLLPDDDAPRYSWKFVKHMVEKAQAQPSPWRDVAGKLADALKEMTDRWEPDTAGKDRIMWENACEALADFEALQKGTTNEGT